MTALRNKLFVPALRAQLGDWIYYVSYMRLSDIAARVSLAGEIHKAKRLQEMIQREVSNRADDIASYLLSEAQRFFNALVIGVYGGQPDWYELEIGSNELLKSDQLPAYIGGSIGVLRFSGGEKLFALDGQHRVEGIRKALGEGGQRQRLANEEVACIFVGHKQTALGLRRTRRLFTTLNRYAKPVSLAEIIALDEDDIAAIVTRAVLEGRGIMKAANVAFSKSRGMTGDTENITNVTTLYTCHRHLLGRTMKPKDWRAYQARRPSDDVVARATDEVEEMWECFGREVEPLAKVAAGRSPASEYRHEGGGHLLFRPIGLEMAVDSVSKMLASDDAQSIRDVVGRLGRVPMTLNRKPWKGLIWSEGGMETGRKALARDLMLYMMGAWFWRGPASEAVAERRLREKLAAALNRDAAEVSLPRRHRPPQV